MRIEIAEPLSVENLIEVRQVETDLTSFSCKLGEFPIAWKEQFMLQLENDANRYLHIFGKTKVVLAMPCDRCLKEVSVPIPIEIGKKYPIKDLPPEAEEEEEDTSYVTGTCLDIDQLVYDEILVNLPMKVLCREDCKGICRKCGINRNDQTCSCGQMELDPRMAAIRDVFKQFKEV